MPILQVSLLVAGALDCFYVHYAMLSNMAAWGHYESKAHDGHRNPAPVSELPSHLAGVAEPALCFQALAVAAEAVAVKEGH